jgi:prepilin-type N-terminal cleavage/methylation domain-containing protein
MHRLRGFTLIELMIAVAIIAIVSAFAIPAYNGYIRESRLGAMRMNLDSLRISVEAFRLDDRNSWYRPASPSPPYVYSTSSTVIASVYGWRPEGDQNAYAYTVSPTSATYNIWAIATGGSAWVRCEKAATTFKCCDGKGGTTSACP